MITLGPPIQWPEWNKKSVDNSQVSKQLARIADIRQKNLTGEAIVFDWMKRRIQPLQARETFGFQYQGTTDSSRFLEEEISDEEVFSRIQRLLENVKDVPVVPDSFSAANPPKQVLDKSSRFVFCRRMWRILRVVLHCQELNHPFTFSVCSYTVNQVLRMFI